MLLRKYFISDSDEHLKCASPIDISSCMNPFFTQQVNPHLMQLQSEALNFSKCERERTERLLTRVSKSPTPTEKSGILGRGSPTFENLLSKAWRKFFDVIFRNINFVFYQIKLKIVIFCHYFLTLYQKVLLKLLQKFIKFSL